MYCYWSTSRSRRNTTESHSLNLYRPEHTVPDQFHREMPEYLIYNWKGFKVLSRIRACPLCSDVQDYYSTLWIWVLVFFLFKPQFLFPAVWTSELKQNKTCSKTAGYNHWVPSWLWFQHCQNTRFPPAHEVYLHIQRDYDKDKWHRTTELRSLLMNANIWLSASGPHIIYRRKGLCINTKSRVLALPSLK